MGDSGQVRKNGGENCTETRAPSLEGSDALGRTTETVRAKGGRREILFALVGVLLFFATVEAALRLLGFSFVPVPVLIDTTWGKPQIDAMNRGMNNIFQRDDLLFWSLRPGAVSPDGRKVNELGLLNGPVAVPKPDGIYRIICLGDSCTALGPADYPSLLHEKLKNASAPGSKSFEVINAGVFTYTSHQGLLLFRERLRGLKPDLVTVYYGWNDHYLTEGYPDKVLRSRTNAPPVFVRLLRHFRTYQLVQRAVHSAQMARIAEMRRGHRLTRVALEDYRKNITNIVRLASKRGARAILLTAPSNHRVGNVPEFFVKHRLAESKQALIDRHRRYNQVLREVAASKGVALLDLEKVFDRLDKDELFVADGVHPNERGRRLIADLLFEKLVEMGIALTDEAGRAAQAKPVSGR